MVWRGGNGNLKLMVYSLNEATGVLSPNGGEDWLCGSTHDIKWNLPNATGNVDINLYKNGVNLGPIVSDIANSGTYSWTINTLEDATKIFIGTDYKVQVRARDGSDSDTSAAFFTISTTLAVTYPTGGENFLKGSSYDITWTSSSCQSAGIKINVYRNSISVANFIEQLTGPNSGSYSWTVPTGYADGNYVLRVKTDDDALSADSGVFSVSTPAASITVTSPKSGDNWTAGQAYDITWTKTGTQSANVKINIFKNSVSQANYIDQIVTVNDGLYSWTIPGTYTTGNYVLRIKTEDNLLYDDSDLFGITNGGGGVTPKLTVISPTQCNTWYKGMTYTITWEKEGTMSSNVKINIFKDSVTPANFIEQLTGPNTGSISWPISGSYADGNYIVRLKTDDNQVYDDSDLFPIAVSSVSPPDITVTSPTSCDSWQKTKTYTITWSKSGTMSSNVKINIFKNSISPSNFVEQLTGSNSGSITWTIGSGYTAGTYLIRIKTDDNAVYGDSQSFQIIN